MTLCLGYELATRGDDQLAMVYDRNLIGKNIIMMWVLQRLIVTTLGT